MIHESGMGGQVLVNDIDRLSSGIPNCVLIWNIEILSCLNPCWEVTALPCYKLMKHRSWFLGPDRTSPTLKVVSTCLKFGNASYRKIFETSTGLPDFAVSDFKSLKLNFRHFQFCGLLEHHTSLDSFPIPDLELRDLEKSEKFQNTWVFESVKIRNQLQLRSTGKTPSVPKRHYIFLGKIKN